MNEDSSTATMVLPLFASIETAASKPNGIALTPRTLKIEEAGDRWKGGIKPKIRLMGKWLERAGFTPGSRVSVECVSPGLLELHCLPGCIVHASEASKQGFPSRALKSHR